MLNEDAVSIGIVDNDPLVSQALEAMFSQRTTPLHVLWNTQSGREALRLCQSWTVKPQAILTDLRMPGMDGKELSEQVLKVFPGIVVIGMTAFQIDYTNDELLQAGMSAVIRKEAPVQEYVQAIGRALGSTRLASWQESAPSFQRMMLTDTELAVLREYLKGRTTAATANIMHMSEGTVKTHMNKAYRKMGVHSRAEAIRICMREHLL